MVSDNTGCVSYGELKKGMYVSILRYIHSPDAPIVSIPGFPPFIPENPLNKKANPDLIGDVLEIVSVSLPFVSLKNLTSPSTPVFALRVFDVQFTELNSDFVTSMTSTKPKAYTHPFEELLEKELKKVLKEEDQKFLLPPKTGNYTPQSYNPPSSNNTSNTNTTEIEDKENFDLEKFFENFFKEDKEDKEDKDADGRTDQD